MFFEKVQRLERTITENVVNSENKGYDSEYFKSASSENDDCSVAECVSESSLSSSNKLKGMKLGIIEIALMVDVSVEKFNACSLILKSLEVRMHQVVD